MARSRTQFPNFYSEQLFKTDYTEQTFVCQYISIKFPNNFSEYTFAFFCIMCYDDIERINPYYIYKEKGGKNIMAYGKITVKQKEILEFIKTEILRKGYRP